MDPDLTIREATNADIEPIRQLVFSVLEEYNLKPDPCSTDMDLDDIEENYARNNGYFIVVEKEKTIVATMGLKRISNDTCELRKMYAYRSVRGKGLGRYLLEHAIARAGKLGYTRIILETATQLKEAISLYKKYGFIEFYPDSISKRCDQAYELILDKKH